MRKRFGDIWHMNILRVNIHSGSLCVEALSRSPVNLVRVQFAVKHSGQALINCGQRHFKENSAVK